MSMKIILSFFLFLNRQEQLKKMRDVDDKIVYALNTSIPTESFKGQLNASAKCTDLYEKLNSTYDSRNKVIKNCIATTANRVKELKAKKDENLDDISLYKDFKSEQRKVHRKYSHQCLFLKLFIVFFYSCDCYNPN